MLVVESMSILRRGKKRKIVEEKKPVDWLKVRGRETVCIKGRDCVDRKAIKTRRSGR